MWWCAPVLGRRIDGRTTLGSGVPGPSRVVDHASCKRDEVRLAARDDLLGLLRFGDQADRNRVDAGALLHGSGKWHLIARTDRDFLQRRDPARRSGDPVGSSLLQLFGKFDGLREVPSTVDPI